MISSRNTLVCHWYVTNDPIAVFRRYQINGYSGINDKRRQSVNSIGVNDVYV